MKITFVLDFAGLAGGVRVVAAYANRLAARGHEVTVVSRPWPKPGLSGQVRHLLAKGRFPTLPAATTLFEPLGARHRTIESFRPIVDADLPDGDLVVATLWKTAEWVQALSSAKGRKAYLMQDYEMFDFVPKEQVAKSYGYDFLRIAVSGYIRDEIARNHGVTDVHVINNAVDLEHFSVPPRAKNERLTLGFMYQPRGSKNVALALEVAEKAMKAVPGLRVVAFGAAERPLEALPLPAGVEYHPRPAQAEIPKIYAACDAWLFTSDAEGFGLPLLEAMACRTPVIATRAGAAPELIRDGVNGWLADSRAEAFLQRVETLQAMSPAQWRALSDGAHATPRAWTWEDAVDRFEALAGEAVSGGRAA